MRIPESELILHPDGSVYHLHLKDEHIADTVLLAGDQGRVAQISRHFDEITFQVQNREFVTHTGWYKGKRITALSSGIGTDNMDIVLNELHAAVNIDPETRLLKCNNRPLRLIRIGTSGALHDDIHIGTFLMASHGISFDGLMYFYHFPFTEEEQRLKAVFLSQTPWPSELAEPYFVAGDELLIKQIGHDMTIGITASGSGFYAPQGRQLQYQFGNIPIRQWLRSFHFSGKRITNFDMESSALYGLGRLFGFACCTVNVIIANRAQKKYQHSHTDDMDRLIETVLNRL